MFSLSWYRYKEITSDISRVWLMSLELVCAADCLGFAPFFAHLHAHNHNCPRLLYTQPCTAICRLNKKSELLFLTRLWTYLFWNSTILRIKANHFSFVFIYLFIYSHCSTHPRKQERHILWRWVGHSSNDFSLHYHITGRFWGKDLTSHSINLKQKNFSYPYLNWETTQNEMSQLSLLQK